MASSPTMSNRNSSSSFSAHSPSSSSSSSVASASQAAVSGLSSLVSYGSSFVSKVLPSSSASSKHHPEDIHLQRDLDRLYHAKVRPILDAVDKLRGILAGETLIKLPTIVVVGDQSSGKSSVLEALSGVSLPRGAHITTRVPLILRLVNLCPDGIKDGESVPPPYALISARGHKEERISSLDQVASSIDNFTRRIAGNNVSVSNDPISLSVYRAFSPDLTLVDLPGITRNPVGDQPKDIEQQIKDMIYSYIRPSESVILTVMPASIDLVTCECRKLARDVDPEGKRTVAVVTKMDQCEKGINNKLRAAVDQLGLELGLVGVRNRAQHESDAGMTWEQAREEETKFFANHSELSAFLIQDGQSSNSKLPVQTGRIQLGTNALAALLTSVQETHIRSIMPKVRKQVGDLLNEARSKQRELPPTWTSDKEARSRFESMVSDLLSRIARVCDGDRTIMNSAPDLNLPARLLDHYRAFDKELSSTGNPNRYLTSEFAKAVDKEMKENVGTSLPNIASPQIVISLIHRELARVFSPAMSLVEQSRLAHLFVLTKLCKQVFLSFPALANTISQQVADFVNTCNLTALQRVEEAISQEHDVFTVGNWYEDVGRKIKMSMMEVRSQISAGKLREGQHTAQANELRVTYDSSNFTLPNSPEMVLETQINVLSYVSLSQKRLSDRLAQIVRYHFTRPLTNSTDGLRNKLQSAWSRVSDAELMESMKEANEVRERREAINQTIAKLEKAAKVFEAL